MQVELIWFLKCLRKLIFVYLHQEHRVLAVAKCLTEAGVLQTHKYQESWELSLHLIVALKK